MSCKCQNSNRRDTVSTSAPAPEDRAVRIKKQGAPAAKNISYRFERSGNVGILAFYGELTPDNENDLAILLMKAIYGVERSVVNLKDVKRISGPCLKLMNKAYHASLRLKRPIIFTDVPWEYRAGLFNRDPHNGQGLPGRNENADERSGTEGNEGDELTGVKNLAEAVILQSIEDLWHPSHSRESREFFSGYASKICYELAGLNNSDRSRLLLLIKENMNEQFDTVHEA